MLWNICRSFPEGTISVHVYWTSNHFYQILKWKTRCSCWKRALQFPSAKISASLFCPHGGWRALQLKVYSINPSHHHIAMPCFALLQSCLPRLEHVGLWHRLKLVFFHQSLCVKWFSWFCNEYGNGCPILKSLKVDLKIVSNCTSNKHIFCEGLSLNREPNGLLRRKKLIL